VRSDHSRITRSLAAGRLWGGCFVSRGAGGGGGGAGAAAAAAVAAAAAEDDEDEVPVMPAMPRGDVSGGALHVRSIAADGAAGFGGRQQACTPSSTQ
jgi:hypothetical protein